MLPLVYPRGNGFDIATWNPRKGSETTRCPILAHVMFNAHSDVCLIYIATAVGSVLRDTQELPHHSSGIQMEWQVSQSNGHTHVPLSSCTSYNNTEVEESKWTRCTYVHPLHEQKQANTRSRGKKRCPFKTISWMCTCKHTCKAIWVACILCDRGWRCAVVCFPSTFFSFGNVASFTHRSIQHANNVDTTLRVSFLAASPSPSTCVVHLDVHLG